MILRASATAMVAISMLLVAGCDDPAKGKVKAVTSEALPNAAEAKAGTLAATHAFDATTSKIEWTGAKVTGKHDGGFKSFRGNVSLVDQTPEKSAVTVEIDTDSLFTDSEKLAGHLKSPDFFDVAKFPKATFASTSIAKKDGTTYNVAGNLTLHGVTKSVAFPATIRTTAAGADVDAELSINRKDFGLVYPGKPDDLIRDDVVIRLTIRAQKKS